MRNYLKGMLTNRMNSKEISIKRFMESVRVPEQQLNLIIENQCFKHSFSNYTVKIPVSIIHSFSSHKKWRNK